MVFIKNLSLIHLDQGWQFVFIGLILLDMAWSLCLIAFIYLVNALGHLSKKHRVFVKIASIIIIISVTSRLLGSINFDFLNETYNAAGILYWNACFGMILTAIYGTATYFILKLKLNLE